MHKFLLKLKIRDCEKVFGPNLEPGIIAVQEIVFDPREKSANIAVALSRQSDAFVESVIVVEIEEIE